MKEEELIWILIIDGLANVQGVGIRIVLESRNDLRLEEGARLGFEVTNNEVEYKTLIYRLELARHLSIKKLKVEGHSTMVIGHMIGVYKVKKL